MRWDSPTGVPTTSGSSGRRTTPVWPPTACSTPAGSTQPSPTGPSCCARGTTTPCGATAVALGGPASRGHPGPGARRDPAPRGRPMLGHPARVGRRRPGAKPGAANRSGERVAALRTPPYTGARRDLGAGRLGGAGRRRHLLAARPARWHPGRPGLTPSPATGPRSSPHRRARQTCRGSASRS